MRRTRSSTVLDVIVSIAEEIGWNEMEPEIPSVALDSLQNEMTELVNRHSLDSATGVPDDILARMIIAYVELMKIPIMEAELNGT